MHEGGTQVTSHAPQHKPLAEGYLSTLMGSEAFAFAFVVLEVIETPSANETGDT